MFRLILTIGVVFGAISAIPTAKAQHYGSYNDVVRCESISNRQRVCSTGFRGGAVLVRQLSRSPCIEGRTWGHGSGGIWVTNGCRAEFASRGGRGGGYGRGGRYHAPPPPPPHHRPPHHRPPHHYNGRP